MKNDKNPTKEQLMELFIEKGMTKQEIADMFGITLDAVKYLTKKYNIRKKDFRDKPESETPEVSIEEKRAEADRIANEMLAHNGVTHKEEPKPTDNKVIEEFLKETTVEDEYISDTVPMEWQGIFNMITRMYESFEEYKFVKYSRAKNDIEITLDKKYYNPKKEFDRIKNIINYDSLKYSLLEYPNNFTIIIKAKV